MRAKAKIKSTREKNALRRKVGKREVTRERWRDKKTVFKRGEQSGDKIPKAKIVYEQSSRREHKVERKQGSRNAGIRAGE